MTRQPATTPDAAGFVLAGGQSRRMGIDKALVEFNGRPLIAHAVEMLQRASLSVAIAGARTELGSFAPVIADAESDLGPLSGISSALAQTHAPWAVFVPVDLPLLPSSLIECLLAYAQLTDRAVTLCSVSGFAQTFPAVIHRDVLSVLNRELQTGDGGCFAAFEAAGRESGRGMNVLAIEILVHTGQLEHPNALPAFGWFLNVNTPGDLMRARALVSRGVA